MHAKKLDKLATAVLYTIAGIIVAILASLILYILVEGVTPYLLVLLDREIFLLSSRWGIGIQLYNSFFLLVITLIISVPAIYGSWCFPR